ncbi:MAG: ATP-binding cassette domain-containing protein [Thiolinea sp.]
MTLGLAEGGIGWAVDENNEELVKPYMEKMAEIEKGIIDGEIKVHDYMSNDQCEKVKQSLPLIPTPSSRERGYPKKGRLPPSPSGRGGRGVRVICNRNVKPFPMYALELRNISKSFGPVIANQDINLQLRRADIHGIIGENGAGKSTLMSIIYGFYEADSGEILIDGQPVRIRNSQQALAHGVGMVHQHFMLVDNFTVLENVMLGAEWRVPCCIRASVKYGSV